MDKKSKTLEKNLTGDVIKKPLPVKVIEGFEIRPLKTKEIGLLDDVVKELIPFFPKDSAMNNKDIIIQAIVTGLKSAPNALAAFLCIFGQERKKTKEDVLELNLEVSMDILGQLIECNQGMIERFFIALNNLLKTVDKWKVPNR